VRKAGLAGEQERVLEMLGSKHGRDFAADVLASLSADIKRVRAC
jgi:hypothetical protein